MTQPGVTCVPHLGFKSKQAEAYLAAILLLRERFGLHLVSWALMLVTMQALHQAPGRSEFP